ncbi:MAG: hypothetical protein KDA57_15120 [Planctomycetales bacterium]|nr:hypothetical protein [Planctomycetales bacterium]
MNSASHSEIRQQQRCIPPLILDLLDRFGTEVPAADGAVRLVIDHKARKKLERHCGRHFVRENSRYFNAYLVIGRHGHTITSGWRQKPVRRK